MSKVGVIAFTVLLIFSACDFFEKLSPRGDKEHEGKMMKTALGDLWKFHTGDEGGLSETRESSRKDVWQIKDLSTRKRARALIEVDAQLQLKDKVLKDKGFRLARHLMLDTKAKIVKIRFWTRGFREEGGVFAELLLSSDGKSWKGNSRGRDKYFRYTPSTRPWKSLSPKDIKLLKSINRYRRKAIKLRRAKPLESALRDVAADSATPPFKLNQLLKRTRRLFLHPKI
jgi:hypothetical protein